MTNSDLYQRLGEGSGIGVVVDDFYRRVLTDERLSQFFGSVDMSGQRRHMTAFLAAATGGPDRYVGRNMTAAHNGLGINDGDFDAVATTLVETLRAHGADANDIAEVVARVGGLRSDVVEVAE